MIVRCFDGEGAASVRRRQVRTGRRRVVAAIRPGEKSKGESPSDGTQVVSIHRRERSGGWSGSFAYRRPRSRGGAGSVGHWRPASREGWGAVLDRRLTCERDRTTFCTAVRLRAEAGTRVCTGGPACRFGRAQTRNPSRQREPARSDLGTPVGVRSQGGAELGNASGRPKSGVGPCDLVFSRSHFTLGSCDRRPKAPTRAHTWARRWSSRPLPGSNAAVRCLGLPCGPR